MIGRAVLAPPQRYLRGAQALLTRAYELFSPVAPRLPGAARLFLLPAVTVVPAERAEERPSTAPDAPAPALLLLEGSTGALVGREFVVENERDERVSARIRLSAFADGAGRTASPAVTVTPTVLELDPGERAVVRVSTTLGEELEADVRYVAHISIPGLSDGTLPVSARRCVLEVA